MCPLSVSEGASFQKQVLHIPTQANTSTPSNKQHNSKEKMALDWSYVDSDHDTHHSEDDDKSHHFHYDRFWRRRHRMLFSIFFKIFLTITHICSLICATIHLAH